MSSKFIQQQLNHLADKKAQCAVAGASFGWATLMRYEPLLDLVEKEGFNGKNWVIEGKCYVFEIGKNCGDVFSANMVESIEMTETGAKIHLKGEKKR